MGQKEEVIMEQINRLKLEAEEDLESKQ